MSEEKINYIRTKEDIRQNNRVLRLSERTKRVFVIDIDRRIRAYEGGGYCAFVKNGCIYNPAFDCDYCTDFIVPASALKMEYGKNLKELIAEGFNLKYAGYHGDGRDAFWNWNTIAPIVQMRISERL